MIDNRRSDPVTWIVGSGVLVLLLQAGAIKASPFLAALPVDLTLLAALIVLAALLSVWLQDRFRLPLGSGWLLILFVAFIPGILFADGNEYGVEKILRFFTLTLLCAVAPLFFVRSERTRWTFLMMIAIFGITFGILALVDSGVVVEGSGRLTLEGSDPISAGRAAGAALVVLLVVTFRRKAWWAAGGAISLFLTIVMFQSGSRGPLLAAGVALVMAGMLSPGTGLRRMMRLIILVGVLGLFVWYGLRVAPELAAQRFTDLATIAGDTSVQKRLLLYNETLSTLIRTPEGIGWGDLYGYLNPGTALDSGWMQYPHNMLLEVVSEGGWLAGAALLGVFVVALRRAYQGVTSTTGLAIFALLLFSALNAMVSGDINGNRLFFTLLGVCLALPTLRRHSARSQAAESFANAREAS